MILNNLLHIFYAYKSQFTIFAIDSMSPNNPKAVDSKYGPEPTKNAYDSVVLLEKCLCSELPSKQNLGERMPCDTLRLDPEHP